MEMLRQELPARRPDDWKRPWYPNLKANLLLVAWHLFLLASLLLLVRHLLLLAWHLFLLASLLLLVRHLLLLAWHLFLLASLLLLVRHLLLLAWHLFLVETNGQDSWTCT